MDETTTPAPRPRRGPRWPALILIALVAVVAVAAWRYIDRWGVLPLPLAYQADLPGDLSPSAAFSTQGSKIQEAPIEDFTFSYTVNSLGFRGVEVDLTPPVSTVMVMGDGYTYGTWVDGDRTLSDELNRLLAQRRSPPRMVSVNAAVPGYTITDHLDYLEEKGARLRPALVVLVLADVDDVWEMSRPVQLRELFRCVATSALCVPRFIYYRVFVDVFRNRERLLAESQEPEEVLYARLFDEYRQRLEQLKALVGTWGGRVLLLTERDEQREAGPREQSPGLAQMTRALEIPLIVLEREDPDRARISYTEDMHWSAQTHRFIAEVLARWIQEHPLPR
jgi:hypothetical protein